MILNGSIRTDFEMYSKQFTIEFKYEGEANYGGVSSQFSINRTNNLYLVLTPSIFSGGTNLKVEAINDGYVTFFKYALYRLGAIFIVGITIVSIW